MFGFFGTKSSNNKIEKNVKDTDVELPIVQSIREYYQYRDEYKTEEELIEIAIERKETELKSGFCNLKDRQLTNEEEKEIKKELKILKENNTKEEEDYEEDDFKIEDIEIDIEIDEEKHSWLNNLLGV